MTGLTYRVDTQADTRTIVGEVYTLPEVEDGITEDVIGAAAEFRAMEETELVNPPDVYFNTPGETMIEVGRIAMAESGAGEVVLLENQIQFLSARTGGSIIGIVEAIIAAITLFGVANDVLDWLTAAFSKDVKIGWYQHGRRMGGISTTTARSIQRAVTPRQLRAMRFFAPGQNKVRLMFDGLGPFEKGGFNLWGWRPQDLWPFS